MASSSSSFSNKHDVFLSFSGEDTRFGFTSHIEAALRRANIATFIDKQLIRGDEISPALLKAIKESKISIVVLSLNYASSSWCLEELVEVLNYRNVKRQIVVPVFYHVDPSDVRNQTGTFGSKFAELKGRDKYKQRLERHQMWKKALRDAAGISGWHVDGTKYESDIVEEIVKNVLRILSYMYPSDDEKHLIGVQSRIRKIESLLRVGLNDIVLSVGIWGMGGIGKTAIARVVFNKIFREFEEYFFALNVGEELESPNGLLLLQQNLLSTILKDRNANIASTLTRQRLGCKRVLIVFDDVKSEKQIKDLIGGLDCFGLGSRIIITTRDRQVLKNCRVDDDNIYQIEGLFRYEALQLFCSYAFQQKYPISGYHKLSERVIEYAKGVPLALTKLGSILFDKTKQVWESAINKLQRMPYKDVQDVLKDSYDELDVRQQNIFLDIACFLKWENRDVVISFCDVDGSQAEFDITVLVDKCLLSMSNNKITMHDLFQEMGRGIIQESSKYPEERSRLWYPNDIYPIFEETMGTRAIEGICLDMSERSKLELDPHVFKSMQNLRFLKIHNSYCEKNGISKIDVSRGLESVLTKLRYLCWHGCPLDPLQLKFYPQNLVVLDMPYSSVEQLWTDPQDLVNLKSINLSHSKNLRKIPDLSLAKNLQRLILEGCTSLSEISSSIQNLKNLIILNLRHCKSLLRLSTSIHAQSLRKVILSYCSNLKTFPDISSSVEELFLDETAIEELPSSIENLSRLVILNLKNCSWLENLTGGICKIQHNLLGFSKIDGFSNKLKNLEAVKVLKAQRLVERVLSSKLCLLIELNLTGCCLLELPSSFNCLFSLKRLLLGRNKFRSIQENIICCLPKLSYIDLSHCESLESFPNLPCHLQHLDAHNCISLKAPSDLSVLSCIILRNARVNFSNCSKLDHKAIGDAMKDALLEIQILEDYKEFYPRPSACICFPGTEIPEWFSFQSSGSFITLKLPSGWYRPDFVNFAMCAVVEFDQNYQNKGQGLVVGCDYKLRINNEMVVLYHGTLRGWHYGTGPDDVNSDHVFLGYDFHMCPSNYYNEMIFQFYVEDLNGKRIDCCKVKKCGLHLIYKESNEEEEEPQHKRLKISNSFAYGNFIYSRKRKRNHNPGDRKFKIPFKANPAQGQIFLEPEAISV